MTAILRMTMLILLSPWLLVAWLLDRTGPKWPMGMP